MDKLILIYKNHGKYNLIYFTREKLNTVIVYFMLLGKCTNVIGVHSVFGNSFEM